MLIFLRYLRVNKGTFPNRVFIHFSPCVLPSEIHVNVATGKKKKRNVLSLTLVWVKWKKPMCVLISDITKNYKKHNLYPKLI